MPFQPPETDGYHPLESYFLPSASDFPRASISDQLPEAIANDWYKKLHASLEEMPTGLVNQGQGWSGGQNSFDIITREGILLLEELINQKGLQTWNVAVRELNLDDGLTPFLIPDFENKAVTTDEIFTRTKTDGAMICQPATDQLYQWDYNSIWSNIFPHVNLFHLVQLAKKYPDIFFGTHRIQGLELIPVPGVQFHRYALKDTDLQNDGIKKTSLQGWDLHWGEHYNEELKSKMRSLLTNLSNNDQLGEIVFDIGCGRFPVSSGLDGNKHNVVLIDKSKEVTSLSGNGRYSLIADLEKMDTPEFRQALRQILKTPEDVYADTIIISDVLNYVDWKRSLDSVNRFLKPGGKIIITNGVDQGYSNDFHPTHIRDNIDLLQHICDKLGYRFNLVQDAMQVCNQRDTFLPISRYSQIIVVARKTTHPM